MATVPTLISGGVDQTDYIQDKTLNWKRKSLDYTLVDPADIPAVHDIVFLDTPAWNGRVTTVESFPWVSASGDQHHYVHVTATNNLTPVETTGPFDLSDTPDYVTSFPYKDLSVIHTLNTDTGDTELRLTGIVYEPGLIPGMTVNVSCDVEGLIDENVFVVEVSANWLRSDAPEYHLDLSKDNVPKIDLPGVIGNAACDCPPFVDCTPTDFTVKSFANGDVMACVFPAHANGQSCASAPGTSNSDAMLVYRGATYRIDYLVFHAATSNNLNAFLKEVGGGTMGTAGPLVGQGTDTAIRMGDIRGPLGCTFDPANDIPAASVDWTAPAGTGDYFYVQAALIESSCTSGDSFASSISAHITWLSGPDPRFESLPACDKTPKPGQPIYPPTTTSDGTTTDFTLDWPYMEDALFVLADGVDWTDQVTETNPETGDYALAYAPPLGSVITVRYRYPKTA